MRARRHLLRSAACALAVLALGAGAAQAERPFITLATSAALKESGLLDQILPKFTADHGIDVRVLAVDAGRALALGRQGGADVLLVNDRAAEEAFVSQRHALERRVVMSDDFLIVGPATDPADLANVTLATAAFTRINDSKAAFVSCSDGCGTLAAELRLWAAAGRDPKAGAGVWYFEAAGGTQATLGMAGEKRAHTLIDRASWMVAPNRRGLTELVAGDPRLRNEYAVLVVNDLRHKGVKFAPAKKLADWLTSYQGRTAIEAFRIQGKQIYVVD